MLYQIHLFPDASPGLFWCCRYRFGHCHCHSRFRVHYRMYSWKGFFDRGDIGLVCVVPLEDSFVECLDPMYPVGVFLQELAPFGFLGALPLLPLAVVFLRVPCLAGFLGDPLAVPRVVVILGLVVELPGAVVVVRLGFVVVVPEVAVPGALHLEVLQVAVVVGAVEVEEVYEDEDKLPRPGVEAAQEVVVSILRIRLLPCPHHRLPPVLSFLLIGIVLACRY